MRHPADLAEDFTLQFFFFSTILNDLDWWAVLRHHGERLRLGLIDGWWCFGIIAMMISFFTLATITPSPHAARDGRTPRTCRLSGVGGGLLQQLDSTGHRGGFGRNGVNRPSRPHCFVRRLASPWKRAFRRRGTHRMGVPHDCASRCEPRVVCNNERLCWRPLLGAETALRGLCFVSHASFFCSATEMGFQDHRGGPVCRLPRSRGLSGGHGWRSSGPFDPPLKHGKSRWQHAVEEPKLLLLVAAVNVTRRWPRGSVP